MPHKVYPEVTHLLVPSPNGLAVLHENQQSA
jgi:hypothetical protein